MKDLYKLLNELDMDETEFHEIEVSEEERIKVKQKLKQSIHRKKPKRRVQRAAIAAAAALGLATAGYAFPSAASQIPVIGDIFSFLSKDQPGVYKEYKQYSEQLNMTETSNGISITINDAVYDGETVTVTYSVESEKNLGEHIHLFDFLSIKGSSGGGGTMKIEQVDKQHYVGISTINSTEEIRGERVSVDWTIESIVMEQEEKEIKGDWQFAFQVDAQESETTLINQSLHQQGIDVTIDKIKITPLSFIVYFSQKVDRRVAGRWHMVDVDLDIRDDLGNVYEGQSNGGSGLSDGFAMNWSKTFEKLDPNAKKLIVTPRVYMSDGANSGGVELTDEGEKAIELPKKEGKGSREFELDDIVVPLNKQEDPN